MDAQVGAHARALAQCGVGGECVIDEGDPSIGAAIGAAEPAMTS